MKALRIASAVLATTIAATASAATYEIDPAHTNARFAIDRTKWGMDYLVKMGMTKNVRIDIQIEAIKK